MRRKISLVYSQIVFQSFNVAQLSGDIGPAICESVSEEVLNTTVTKAEMADALGMRENDLFVERIFACMAKGDPDRVTFLKFLDVIAKFARGIKTVLFFVKRWISFSAFHHTIPAIQSR